MARKPIPFNGYIEPQKGEYFLIVNIKKTFFCDDVSDVAYCRPDLYECTRKYWRIAANKIPKITRVLGHVDGIVQCVITPARWHNTKMASRYECDGTVEDGSPYLGKSVLGITDIGQNPVRYYDSAKRKKELYYIESIHDVYEFEDIEWGENGMRFMTNNGGEEMVPSNRVQVTMFKVNSDGRYPVPLILEMDRQSLQYAGGNLGSVVENEYVYYAPNSDSQFENASQSPLVLELVSEERENRENVVVVDNPEELDSLLEAFAVYDVVESFHVNVGHGNCSLILAYNERKDKYKLMMVDCSVFDYTNKRNYATNLKKCFDYIAKKLHISADSVKLSAFLLTHTHYDHYSGLEYLIDKGYVDSSTIFSMNIWYGCTAKTWNRILGKMKGFKVIEPISVRNPFVVFPDRRQVNKRSGYPNERVVSKVNDSSAVYWLGYHWRGMVFPGDLEQKGLEEMNKNHWCRRLYHYCLYYCVSHHGSITGHINVKCQHEPCATKLKCVSHGLRRAIIMGRDGAFSGIYSPVVINDFGKRIIYSEKDYMGNSIRFAELDWHRNVVKYH